MIRINTNYQNIALVYSYGLSGRFAIINLDSSLPNNISSLKFWQRNSVAKLLVLYFKFSRY